MKMKASTGRKLRYGGVSALLTALIIAVVIIVNVIFSALVQKFMWYGDLTPDMTYTLTDECIDLIANGDKEYAESSKSPIEMVEEVRAEKLAEDPDFDVSSLKINIIFCTEKDKLEDNATQNYILRTALDLEAEFDDYIDVLFYNIIRNPSSVDKFRTNSQSTIATSSVIVEFGTEYRVRQLRSFYVFNSDTDDEPWAYNGEKAFASSILAVTRAESPIACLTTGHGETFTDEQFINTLYDAGYIVQALNMTEQEIPEKCRLMIIFNPDADFHASNGNSEAVDEIEMLDEFLDAKNSLMVFMSPNIYTSTVERLTNLEDYLEEWGISFDKYTDAANNSFPYRIMDGSQSLTVDGYKFKAEYVTAGTGASMTESMRESGGIKPVVFKDAMSISYSELYSPAHYTPDETEDPDGVPFDYATYSVDGTYRSIYDVFTTSSKAVALANGVEVEVADEINRLRLMTVTVEGRTVQEDNYSTVNQPSYVIACGSVDFASSEMLQSNSYGNTDVLLTALRTIGQEPVPVGIEFKPFADYTIDTITTAESTQYTIVLSVVPAIVALVTGFVIIVRRKFR